MDHDELIEIINRDDLEEIKKLTLSYEQKYIALNYAWRNGHLDIFNYLISIYDFDYLPSTPRNSSLIGR